MFGAKDECHDVGSSNELGHPDHQPGLSGRGQFSKKNPKISFWSTDSGEINVCS